jgi:hypothetical protein
MDKRLQDLDEMVENDQVNGLYPEGGQIVYSLDGELFDHDQPNFDEGEIYYSGKAKNIDAADLIGETMAHLITEQVEDNLNAIMPEEVDVEESLKNANVKDVRKLLIDYYNQDGMINCFQVVDIKEHIMKEE